MCEDKLATRPEAAIMLPVVSPNELIEAQKATHNLIKKALEDKRDYGTIPGTGKPTLLKPGAERLLLAFAVYPKYTVVESEIDHEKLVKYSKGGQEKESVGLYRYVVRCTLHRKQTDELVGDGIGSASTLESKYISRPRDLENTVLKMAAKRALIAGTLNVFALSDRFTQDMEDAPQAADGDRSAPQADKPRDRYDDGAGAYVKFKPKRAKGDIDKGMRLADVTDDADLHQYAEAIQWGLDNSKGYATAEHLADIHAEIARRENGDDGNGREGAEPQPADEGAPPPHDDDDSPIPF